MYNLPADNSSTSATSSLGLRASDAPDVALSAATMEMLSVPSTCSTTVGRRTKDNATPDCLLWLKPNEVCSEDSSHNLRFLSGMDTELETSV